MVVRFEANLILGSVIFLFKGYFDKILQTKDFKWSRDLLKTNDYFFDCLEYYKFQIDELVIDNTFCDPIFTFPSQVLIIRQSV